MPFKVFVVTFISIFIFTGCMPEKSDVQYMLQSNAANSIKSDYDNIQELLLEFKKKLDKRNPKSYDKKLVTKINDTIQRENKLVYLRYRGNVLENYKEYLQIAFSKIDVSSRNDYLILGLYYLLYEAYEIEGGHKLFALEYDKDKLQKLYKNLQIVKWRIKTAKNVKNQYLFLTWQNNWQVELEKRINNNEEIDFDTLRNLEYIKNKKETLLDSSNFSFEVILTQMIDDVGNSLKALGEEPRDLTINTVRGMFLFF